MPGLLHLGCRPARWGSLPSYDEVERQLIPLATVTPAVAEMAVGAGIWKRTEPPRSCGCASSGWREGRHRRRRQVRRPRLGGNGGICGSWMYPIVLAGPEVSAHQNNSGPGIFWQRRACGLPARRRGCIFPPTLSIGADRAATIGNVDQHQDGLPRRAPSAHGCVNTARGHRGCGAAGKTIRASTRCSNRGHCLPFARNLQPDRRFNHASNLCFRFCL